MIPYREMRVVPHWLCRVLCKGSCHIWVLRHGQDHVVGSRSSARHCSPMQAESGQVTSEQKKTLALGSLTLSGPPAAWCVTHWGSPGASAEVLGTFHRQSGGEGTRVGGL